MSLTYLLGSIVLYGIATYANSSFSSNEVAMILRDIFKPETQHAPILFNTNPEIQSLQLGHPIITNNFSGSSIDSIDSIDFSLWN